MAANVLVVLDITSTLARMLAEIQLVLSLAKATHGIHKLLERYLGPNGNFIEKRDELFRDWLVELVDRVQAFECTFNEHERAEFAKRTADDEFAAITANYFRAAHEEPLNERRRMLSFAAATIANLSLSVAQLARIQRVLKELDPEDVIQLHRLWLIPTRSPAAKYRKSVDETAGALAYRTWQGQGAEALEASGCVAVRTSEGGFGRGSWNELLVTALGQTLRRAMRPYILARDPDITDVPGHEVTTAFRSVAEAEAEIATLPNLRAVLLKARGRLGLVQFDGANIADGAPHNARTRLIFEVPESEAKSLGPVSANTALPEASVLDHVFVGHISEPHDGKASIQVWGPHDVLRFLAYEFDFRWA